MITNIILDNDKFELLDKEIFLEEGMKLYITGMENVKKVIITKIQIIIKRNITGESADVERIIYVKEIV